MKKSVLFFAMALGIAPMTGAQRLPERRLHVQAPETGRVCAGGGYRQAQGESN